MISLAEDGYLPFLKWKMGEATALSELSAGAAHRVTPLFVMPPAGDHDPEEGRTLTPIEHIRQFGPRLARSRGKRLAFVDALHVDDDRHSADLGRHPLTELIERARLAGALASPITSFQRSEAYQHAIGRHLAMHPDLPICIRLTPADLLRGSIETQFRDLLMKIQCKASKSVLVVDTGFYDGHAPSELIQALVQQISAMPFRDEWIALALSITSFPDSLDKIKTGETRIFPRYDWSIFKGLFSDRTKFGRSIMFSDYAVEHPIFGPTSSGLVPTAHFRYSSEQRYLIIKGKSVRKPNGYEAIYPVAEALTAHEDYQGSSSSWGDWYISQVAQHLAKGTAWQWREASVNHHLEMVVRGLRTLFGTREKDTAMPATAYQPPLL